MHTSDFILALIDVNQLGLMRDALGLIALLIVILMLRWVPQIGDTLVQSFSGEKRGLMVRGFLRHGSRLRRTIELESIVSRLALIARMNLPLEPALRGAAWNERRRLQIAMQAIAGKLAQGTPVSTALEEVVRGCPPPLVEALRQAEGCGQLAGALEQQERMIHTTIEDQLNTTAHLRHALVYGALMMLFCLSMVMGIVVVLIPKYKEIFLDFEVALPSITMTLLGLADWFAVTGWVILVTSILLLLCGILIFFATGADAKMNRVVAGIRSWLPLTRTMDHGLGMARASRAMALALRSGTPHPFSASYAPLISRTNPLRAKLDQFSFDVAHGATPHSAAGDAGLGQVLVCALRMAERGEDAERALNHAADYYEAIAHRWWHALLAVSGPLVTVGMGFMVGFVAVALFMPLIALIDSVSGAW